MSILKAVYGIMIFSIFTIFFSGCATMPREADREALLKEAINKYWQFRLEDKYEDAYKMEEPSGLPAFEDYVQKAGTMKKFRPESFSIGSIQIEGDKGNVHVNINVHIGGLPKSVRDTIQEEWIFRDGAWRHKFYH